MTPTLASLAALVLSVTAMAALSLAMDRHYAHVFGQPEPPRLHRIALRTVGWFMLAASLWPCVEGWGLGVGLVAWCAWLAVASQAVALALSYSPNRSPQSRTRRAKH